MRRVGKGWSRLAFEVTTALSVGVILPQALSAQLPAAASSSASPYDLSNPGARSRGLAGAFVGLADDATASYTNPAGLAILTRPEIAFGVTRRSKLEGDSTAPFAAYVHPVQRWTFGFLRHQSVEFTTTFDGTSPAGLPTPTAARVDVVGHGLAASYRVNRKLSLGLTTLRNEARVRSASPGLSDDSDVTLTGGVLIHPHRRLGIGFVYRSGASFGRFGGQQGGETLDVPDVAAIGAGIRLTQRLTLSLEWDRLLYSTRTPSSTSPSRGAATEEDDADELRVGFEWACWQGGLAPTLRFGAWYDGDDTTTYDGFTDELHFAWGFGVVAGRRLQLDAAFDYVDSDRYTLELTGLLRF